MTSPLTADASFTDALTGADGTGDPAAVLWRGQVFADPLAEVQTSRSLGEMPEVPVPDLDALQRSLAKLRAEVEENVARAKDETDDSSEQWWNHHAASPAERAAAARQAAAQRVEDVVAHRLEQSSARPGVAPARSAAQAPVIVAHTGGPMPQAYFDPAPARSAGSQSSAFQPAAFQQPQQFPPAAAPRGQRTMQSSVQRTPHSAPHRPQMQRPQAYQSAPKRKSGGAWGFLVILVLFLVFSGAGAQLLDNIKLLFEQ